jgi:hypothetical protein
MEEQQTQQIELTSQEIAEQKWVELVTEVDAQIAALGLDKETIDHGKWNRCVKAAHAKINPQSIEDKNLMAQHKRQLRQIFNKERKAKHAKDPMKGPEPVVTEVDSAMKPPVLETVEVSAPVEAKEEDAPVEDVPEVDATEEADDEAEGEEVDSPWNDYEFPATQELSVKFVSEATCIRSVADAHASGFALGILTGCSIFTFSGIIMAFLIWICKGPVIVSA